MNTLYKIKIVESESSNQHVVKTKSEFTNIEEAIKCCLAERKRLLLEYGEIEQVASREGLDLSYCYEHYCVMLELVKYNDGEIEQLNVEDYSNISTVLLHEFKNEFIIDNCEGASCLNSFFYYPN